MRPLAVALTLALLVGCKKPDPSLPPGKRIALLLPEAKTARYESHDRPHFERRVKELCPTCEVIYANAGQDAAKQQSQAEAALTNGAKVLVIDPVDGRSARVIAERAKAEGAKVIAYDRLILGTDAVDGYVAFEAEAIGRFQANALYEALGRSRALNIVMINGSPTDPNAALLKIGAHAVFDGRLNILKEYDTPDWSPDKAQEEMTQALTALSGQKLDGVYAANDGTAGGVIAALKAAGAPLVPVTGQDAELAALQRIIVGDQHSTIYKPLKLEAESAAQMAVDLLFGRAPATKETADNGVRKVPALVLEPTSVTKANLKATVLADGFWQRDALCTDAYQAECKAAGL